MEPPRLACTSDHLVRPDYRKKIPTFKLPAGDISGYSQRLYGFLFLGVRSLVFYANHPGSVTTIILIHLVLLPLSFSVRRILSTHIIIFQPKRYNIRYSLPLALVHNNNLTRLMAGPVWYDSDPPTPSALVAVVISLVLWVVYFAHYAEGRNRIYRLFFSSHHPLLLTGFTREYPFTTCRSHLSFAVCLMRKLVRLLYATLVCMMYAMPQCLLPRL